MTSKRHRAGKHTGSVHLKFVRAGKRNFTRVGLENLPRIKMRDLINGITQETKYFSTADVLTQMESHIGGRWSIIEPADGYTSLWNQWVVFERQEDLDLLRLIYG